MKKYIVYKEWQEIDYLSHKKAIRNGLTVGDAVFNEQDHDPEELAVFENKKKALEFFNRASKKYNSCKVTSGRTDALYLITLVYLQEVDVHDEDEDDIDYLDIDVDPDFYDIELRNVE